jgi:hypothetical protein
MAMDVEQPTITVAVIEGGDDMEYIGMSQVPAPVQNEKTNPNQTQTGAEEMEYIGMSQFPVLTSDAVTSLHQLPVRMPPVRMVRPRTVPVYTPADSQALNSGPYGHLLVPPPPARMDVYDKLEAYAATGQHLEEVQNPYGFRMSRPHFLLKGTIKNTRCRILFDTGSMASCMVT